MHTVAHYVGQATGLKLLSPRAVGAHLDGVELLVLLFHWRLGRTLVHFQRSNRRAHVVQVRLPNLPVINVLNQVSLGKPLMLRHVWRVSDYVGNTHNVHKRLCVYNFRPPVAVIVSTVKVVTFLNRPDLLPLHLKKIRIFLLFVSDTRKHRLKLHFKHLLLQGFLD